MVIRGNYSHHVLQYENNQNHHTYRSQTDYILHLGPELQREMQFRLNHADASAWAPLATVPVLAPPAGVREGRDGHNATGKRVNLPSQFQVFIFLRVARVCACWHGLCSTSSIARLTGVKTYHGGSVLCLPKPSFSRMMV